VRPRALTHISRFTLLLLCLVIGCTNHDSQTDQPVNTSETPMEDARNTTDEWPFESPRNLAVITLDRIMDGRNPILYVSHDEDDGGWQFLDGGDVSSENAMVVGLSEVAAHDPTICQLADLPVGWYAFRESSEKPWQRSAQSP